MISAAVSMRQARLVRTATAHRSELNRYISRVQTALELMINAETGQRGYLLTDRESYLRPYRNAVAQAPRILGALQAEPLADLRLSAHIARIRQLDGRKLAEL